MLRDIKKKAKIRVDKGAFLLGVLDATETLQENQICCCVSDPCNPSSRKSFSRRIVFPAIGYRDIPSECSGGDLGGDYFTVIYDERLIPPKVYEPMNYEARKPKMVANVTMEDIQTFFVKYILSDKLGMIANAHLAKADFFEIGALHGQCKRLAQLHSDAVDFPKTGNSPEFPAELCVSKFPDFMEKTDKPSYESQKVLGTLYRSINISEEYTPQTNLNIEKFDERLYVEGYEVFFR
ncbi:hypothetical protein RclHR1_18010002 [Rhizophagus clarus]|uniref:RNA-dependent RNA polymerase n=1 Tax=Rhizophagus clarus TaxID=94130 RepID=A0A2Z6REF5_9GLOM|nr:hypothetical protein RclHR1_18010002 [Rhizophagus clarus]